MKFLCERTSNYGETIQPCEEAVLMPFTYVDRRTVNNPNKNRYLADWYNIGTNHRVEDGMIARDFAQERWFVELNSFEDLQDFLARHGHVVLGHRSDSVAPYLVLKIYDTYRE